MSQSSKSFAADSDFSIDLLKTPERELRDAEIKQVAKVAMEIGEIEETNEHFSLVKKDPEFVAAVGETEQMKPNKKEKVQF